MPRRQRRKKRRKRAERKRKLTRNRTVPPVVMPLKKWTRLTKLSPPKLLRKIHLLLIQKGKLMNSHSITGSYKRLAFSTFVMDEFKRVYSNEDTATKAIPYFWEHFDKENYSIWYCEYKYPQELTLVFMSCNLITGKPKLSFRD